MKIQQDSRGQNYIEVPMGNGEDVRITHIPNGWNGGPSVRVQIRDDSGRLRQGPDFPEDILSDVIKAMVELIR